MRNRLGGQSGMTGRVLLLSPSQVLGGGIERYVQTPESAFATAGVACQRPSLSGCRVRAHARSAAALLARDFAGGAAMGPVLQRQTSARRGNA